MTMTTTTTESAAARLEVMASPRVIDHDAMATEQCYATHLLEILGSEIVERTPLDQETTDRLCALLESAEARIRSISRLLDECVMVDEAAQAEEVA